MDTDTLERVDLDVVVEEVLGHENVCEAPPHEGCTVKAVALGGPTCGIWADATPVFLCQWVVDFASYGASVGGVCGDCKRPLLDCWRIVPI